MSQPEQRNANEVMAETLLDLDATLTEVTRLMEEHSEAVLDIGHRLGRMEKMLDAILRWIENAEADREETRSG